MVQRERNRLQRFLTLRWLQFALPNCDAMPTHFSQFTLFLLVPLLVPANLCYPKVSVRLGNLTTLRVS